MNVGRLRHQVTIIQAVPAPDGAGGLTKTWTALATVWAAVDPLRGREYFAAQQVTAEITHKVTLRYLTGVRPEMRVQFGDREFDIMAVINPQERNIYLELMCVEAPA